MNVNKSTEYSKVNKDMGKDIKCESISEENDMQLYKYIKEPYPVPIKENYKETCFIKNRN